MASPILAAKKVSVFFGSPGGGTEALKDADLEGKEGESLAIVGESGSGKTTLLRACLGLVPLSSGSIWLFGSDISGCNRPALVSLRRRCGYIPQDPFGCVPPTLNALDAAAEPIRLAGGGNRGQALEKARELLSEVGLDDPGLWKERVRLSLSGGQRQRVSIARALSLDPELLLADEPASMQDAATRGEVLRILKRRTRGGMGMVIATHDLPFAASSADRVMVMYKGSVVESGPPEMIVKDPLHPYSRALIEAIPGIGKKMTPPYSEREWSHGGCPFAPRCPLREEICRQEPSLKEVRSGRNAACWRIT